MCKRAQSKRYINIEERTAVAALLFTPFVLFFRVFFSEHLKNPQPREMVLCCAIALVVIYLFTSSHGGHQKPGTHRALCLWPVQRVARFLSVKGRHGHARGRAGAGARRGHRQHCDAPLCVVVLKAARTLQKPNDVCNTSSRPFGTRRQTGHFSSRHCRDFSWEIRQHFCLFVALAFLTGRLCDDEGEFCVTYFETIIM